MPSEYYDNSSPNGNLLCGKYELKNNLMNPASSVGYFFYKLIGGVLDSCEENFFQELENLTVVRCDPSYLDLFAREFLIKRDPDWTDEEYRAIILLKKINVNSVAGLEYYLNQLNQTSESGGSSVEQVVIIEKPNFLYSNHTSDNARVSDEFNESGDVLSNQSTYYVQLPVGFSIELFNFIKNYLPYNLHLDNEVIEPVLNDYFIDLDNASGNFVLGTLLEETVVLDTYESYTDNMVTVSDSHNIDQISEYASLRTVRTSSAGYVDAGLIFNDNYRFVLQTEGSKEKFILYKGSATSQQLGTTIYGSALNTWRINKISVVEMIDSFPVYEWKNCLENEDVVTQSVRFMSNQYSGSVSSDIVKLSIPPFLTLTGFAIEQLDASNLAGFNGCSFGVLQTNSNNTKIINNK